MKQLCHVAAVATLVMLARPFPAAAGEQTGVVPEGKGSAALLRACVVCHDIDVVTRTRYTETGWRRMVDLMVEHGAELSESEIPEVTAYLAKYFGKVNVNKAAVAQLEEALGLTEKEALAIISYREQNGDIRSLEQLRNVPGLNPDKIQAKVAVVAFRD